MDQIRLIEKLMALQPPAYLFGGWAEDALLHGMSSRPHDDIDLLVWLDDLPKRLAQVRALGFDRFHTKLQFEEDRPIVIGCWKDGFELELIIVQRGPGGRAFFDLPLDGELRRVWLADDAFRAPASHLDNVAVRTLSPLALYQIRIACKDLFGGYRAKDEVSQAKLKARFFATTPEAKLQPRVEAIAQA